MGRRTIRDPDGQVWDVRRRWALHPAAVGPEPSGGLWSRIRARARRGRSVAGSPRDLSLGESTGGLLDVFDEVGLVIAVLAAVVLATLLVVAFFVVLLIELVLAMVVLIVGVVWRGMLRHPWTIEAVRLDTVESDRLETIVVDPVVLGDEVGSESEAPPAAAQPPRLGVPPAPGVAPPREPSPEALAKLPAPDVTTTVDGAPGSEVRRLAWRIVGWRAGAALRRTAAEHLSAFGPAHLADR